jgi:hypothetical protein
VELDHGPPAEGAPSFHTTRWTIVMRAAQSQALGGHSALAQLSVLVHFFENGRWGSPAKTDVEEQCLTEEDQLFILMQAGLYLIHARGMSAPEARICWERAESLCHSLNRPVRRQKGKR